MPKFGCTNSPFVKIAKDLVQQAAKAGVSKIIPLTPTDVKEIETALDVYNKDCTICTNGGNMYDCFKSAETKLIRAMPFLRKTVYPWGNYDWSYANFIDNNYSVMATGATKSGNWEAMFKNIDAFIKLTKGYLIDPNPSSGSYPGKFAQDGDINWYSCSGTTVDGNGNVSSNPNLGTACRAKVKVKYSNKLPPPTTDPFLKQYPVTGKSSSSYYIKIGSCPRPDIKSEPKCSAQGYDWTPNPLNAVMKAIPFANRTATSTGSCSQPRYAYINNKPGFDMGGVDFEGLIPSLAQDFLALSPDKIFAALQGYGIENLLAIQPCPKVSYEGFRNYTNQKVETKNIIYTIIIILLVFIFLFIVKKIFK